ncbi:MAG: hypothetical protein K2X94_02495, partial [Amoebophilaceae bacterium]|nr:hypothetical protein [Amoebophilaceae bacterium]
MHKFLLNSYYFLYGLPFLILAHQCKPAPSTPDNNNNKLAKISDRVPLGAPAGIPNLGNTCFMNAGLQVVAALYAHKITDTAPA